MKVSIDFHTLERWNERVGTIVSLETLKNSLDDQGIGMIDNDIIFT
jgi:hypothetical protein